MKRLVLILLLFIPGFLFSQESFVVDSLTLSLQSAKEDSTRIQSLWKLSDIFRNTNLNKSLSYADSALIIAKETDLLDFQAISYKNIGEILFKIGLDERALQNYLMCKKMLEKQKDTLRLISLNHNIGGIYYRLYDYGNALKYFKEALGACNEVLAGGDSFFAGKIQVIYNSIGSTYDLTGENELALSYYQKAEQYARKNQDYFNLGVIYNNLGKLVEELGDKDKALRYLNLSLENRQKINDKNGMARSFIFLSKYFFSNGDFAKALASVENAISIIKVGGDLVSQRDAFDMLFRINRKLGNDGKALDAHMAFVSMKDSLFNEAAVKEITSLQMQYDFDKLEKERLVMQQRKEMVYSFLIAMLVTGLIITGLLYGFLKNRARRITLEKQNLEKDLEVKNKELTTNVMYLLKKNELIGNISKRLLHLKSHSIKDNVESLQKIIFDLQAGADHDVWKEFELRFQQVHTDFYRKLSERARDITPAELKICAFLRLNMTSKEISAITHQSVATIEVLRTRIRKKLALTNKDINLVTYLSEF